MSRLKTLISFEKMPNSLNMIKGIIFDLDGTLYSQKHLRIRMAADLLCHYIFHPHAWKDLHILYRFRRLREEMSTEGLPDIAIRQYLMTAASCNCSVERVKRVVDEWLMRRPLKYLALYRSPLVDELVSWISEQDISIAVLSDYPPKEKLKVLGLSDTSAWSCEDLCINRLKPDPSGLLHICQFWNISPQQCLVIGDRDDRDGEAARRAGMPYIIVPKGLFFSSIGQVFAKYLDSELLE